MIGIDLTLTEEQKKSYEQTVQDARKPTIPSGSLCKFLLYDVDTTQSALARAEAEGRTPNLLDGIAINLAILSYFKDAKTEIKVIDYSDAENIVLPFGKGLRPKASYYLNTTRLAFLGYKKPEDEDVCRTLYNQAMERDLGIPHGTIRFEGGSVVPIIFYSYRYIDTYYKKSDLMSDKETPKPGAVKQIRSVITCYNRETQKSDIAPVETMPVKTAGKIFSTIQEMFPPAPADEAPPF